VANRILTSLSQPFDIDGQQLSVGISIGIACSETDGCSTELLLRAADLALYRAKREGRRTFRFYEPEMGAKLRELHKIRTALEGALEQNEFELAYQPVVAIDTLEVQCCEALLRWPRSRLGPLSPAVFIPAA